jgi:NAD(P)-dependent dehydrogenase (short-subunit alcohol dehydrogenase family)
MHFRGQDLDMGTERFTGKQAIVTGAGSGIGAALCRALAQAGAHVLCTDIDADAAEKTAAANGQRAARLDVTDPDAVQAAVDHVVSRCGRLDFMFNNAGIAWGGDTELLMLDQWNAIIDVNIRGVVHGVAAAYPLMVRQGHGHIVNTASMAGLAAAGQITSYVMTKHAIVGLSLALRSEAAAHGVGVLAICAAAVETPLLDKGAIGGFVGRDYYLKGQGVKAPYDPDRLARDTLRAIERNKALLVKPVRAHAAWWCARLAPGLMQKMSIRFIAQQRAAQGARATAPMVGPDKGLPQRGKGPQ